LSALAAGRCCLLCRQSSLSVGGAGQGICSTGQASQRNPPHLGALRRLRPQKRWCIFSFSLKLQGRHNHIRTQQGSRVSRVEHMPGVERSSAHQRTCSKAVPAPTPSGATGAAACIVRGWEQLAEGTLPAHAKLFMPTDRVQRPATGSSLTLRSSMQCQRWAPRRIGRHPATAGRQVGKQAGRAGRRVGSGQTDRRGGQGLVHRPCPR